MSGCRIDKWLFHARFCRTRAGAQEMAAAGRVRLNGARVNKPAQMVKPGDILTLQRSSQVMAVRVVALAQRRGGAGQAQALYEALPD